MTNVLNRRAGWVFFMVGMLALVASFFLPWSHARGEFWLFGFGTMAVPYLFGLMSFPNRRHEFSMGVYMFVAAFSLSRSLLWPEAPGWIRNSLLTAFMLACGWNIFESLMQTRDSRIAASNGNSFLARRTPLQLAMLVVAAGAMIVIVANLIDA